MTSVGFCSASRGSSLYDKNEKQRRSHKEKPFYPAGHGKRHFLWVSPFGYRKSLKYAVYLTIQNIANDGIVTPFLRVSPRLPFPRHCSAVRYLIRAQLLGHFAMAGTDQSISNIFDALLGLPVKIQNLNAPLHFICKVRADICHG